MKKTRALSLFIGFLLLSNQSCGQHKKVMNEKAAAILGDLYKTVKFSNQAVNYHAEIQIGGCAFEVLINDSPVYKYAGNDGSGSVGLNSPINTNILKSGKQTWEIRVFPPEFNGKKLSVLPEGVKIELSIERLKTGRANEAAEPLILMTTPKKEIAGKQIYADAGKPFMVYKGTFMATVPYELKGWTESADLSKEDSTSLKKELVAAYEKYRNWLQQHDGDQLANGVLEREKETAQALFYDKTLNDDFLAAFLSTYLTENLTMYPLEHYKMVFSGNGKMVTLERTDHVYDPALAGWYLVKKEGEERNMLNTYELNFHRPKPGAALEVIR